MTDAVAFFERSSLRFDWRSAAASRAATCLLYRCWWGRLLRCACRLSLRVSVLVTIVLVACVLGDIRFWWRRFIGFGHVGLLMLGLGLVAGQQPCRGVFPSLRFAGLS